MKCDPRYSGKTIDLELRPDPFDPETRNYVLPAGVTIREAIDAVPDLPVGFDTFGIARVNGQIVPRENWVRVTPRPDGPVPAVIELCTMPAGGGEKDTLTTIAAVFILVAATLVSGGVLFPGLANITFLGGAITGSQLAAVGITAVGALALQSLAPSPARLDPITPGGAASIKMGDAGLSGNTLEPGGVIPRPLGEARITPPFIQPPYGEIVGDDHFVSAIVIVAGRTKIGKIWFGQTRSGAVSGEVTTEKREGLPADTNLTLVDKVVREEPAQISLSKHLTTDGLNIVSPSSQNLPKPHVLSSLDTPDQIWINLMFLGLAHLGASGPGTAVMPLRIRIRKAGTTGGSGWIKLPEIHIKGSRLSRFRLGIKLDWGTAPSATASPFPIVYHKQSSATDPWEADALFDPGGVDPVREAANVVKTNEYLHIMLSGATFPKQRWEVEVTRGAGYVAGWESTTAYTYQKGGTDPSEDGHYFSHVSNQVIEDQTIIAGDVIVESLTSWWDQYPVGKSGYSLMAIRVKNRRLEPVSFICTPYVNVWNGSDWLGFSDSRTTGAANAAALFRHVLRDASHNAKPADPAVIDDAQLGVWYDRLVTDGRDECGLVAAGESVEDYLRLLAAIGFATLRRSEKWGVAIEKDTSADPASPIYSARNSRNLLVKKSIPPRVHAFDVTYQDRLDGHRDKQITVYDDGFNAGNATEIQRISYRGFLSSTVATARAKLDIRSLRLRSVTYSLEVPAQHTISEKGDLVGINDDFLSEEFGSARILSVQKSGANVTGVTVDDELPLKSVNNIWNVTDIWALTNIWNFNDSGVSIVGMDGVLVTKQVVEETNTKTLTFTTPFAMPQAGGEDTIVEECLIVCGILGSEFIRAKIADIAPGPELTAKITMVDEAPGLHAA